MEKAEAAGVTMLEFQEAVIQMYGKRKSRRKEKEGSGMIEAVNLTKYYGKIAAVDHVNAEIKEGTVFGLIGTNGAGKSTFLRMAAGILKPDEGSISLDGEPVFENPKAKARFFYISDEQHFLGNSSPEEMAVFYRSVYPAFDRKRFF